MSAQAVRRQAVGGAVAAQANNRQSYYKVLTKCLLKYQYLYFVMFSSENDPCFYVL